MAIVPTPNQGFPNPTLTEPGPQYAADVSESITEIDTALGGESTGPGTALVDLSKQITTGNISADGYNFSNARSIQFTNNLSPLTGSQDVNSANVVDDVFGFNDANGVFHPIVNEDGLIITSIPFLNLIPRSITSN